jgi:hypothetical protein
LGGLADVEQGATALLHQGAETFLPSADTAAMLF